MSFRIIWKKFATIATLATNQEPTLVRVYQSGLDIRCAIKMVHNRKMILTTHWIDQKTSAQSSEVTVTVPLRRSTFISIMSRDDPDVSEYVTNKYHNISWDDWGWGETANRMTI